MIASRIFLFPGLVNMLNSCYNTKKDPLGGMNYEIAIFGGETTHG